MSYTAEISRSNPTCFLFIIDQSGSMSDVLSTGRTKAQQVADVLNRTLASLITRCTKSEGTRDYFEVGVIGYGLNGATNGFNGSLSSQIIHPISAIENEPLRIEERLKRMDDGAGGLVEHKIKFPVWFEAVANGGTPMNQALNAAAYELTEWCNTHPDSYPPTVLHITDGESTDGSPVNAAKQLTDIRTNDGNVLLFNLHISNTNNKESVFNSDNYELHDHYAQTLFEMSSVLPSHLLGAAREKGFHVNENSRGFMFNAEAVQIVDFFDIGTRASQLR
ncbi:hypothetical protein A4G20_09035 [Pasteurellaceae bacterium RH1A]|nr:hypothetical protein A4G20_09035 [Pasteurellaceae bacterium RH1A]